MAFGDSAPRKNFVSLKDVTELAILGDEVSGRASYDSAKKQYVYDQNGNFRFGVHAWDGSGVSILEGGWRLFKALRNAVAEHGANTVLRVSAVGEGVSKDFTVEAVRQLNDDEAAVIAKSEHVDLSKTLRWCSQNGQGQDDTPF